jgi:hypothetical protein
MTFCREVRFVNKNPDASPTTPSVHVERTSIEEYRSITALNTVRLIKNDCLAISSSGVKGFTRWFYLTRLSSSRINYFCSSTCDRSHCVSVVPRIVRLNTSQISFDRSIIKERTKLGLARARANAHRRWPLQAFAYPTSRGNQDDPTRREKSGRNCGIVQC